MLTFQQLVLKLQDYWDQKGCAILQPYDMEVGAGTSHTATFLRALGPLIKDGFDYDKPGSLDAFNQRAMTPLAYDVRP